MSDIHFEWMWSQIADAIDQQRRSTYHAILLGSWEGKGYKSIAKDTKYSEAYICQDLAKELWKLLELQFGVPISKKTLVLEITKLYEECSGSKNKKYHHDAKRRIVPVSVSPFGDMGCITNDERFYDRENVLGKMLTYLNAYSNISLVGERQVGKSSLLRKLCRYAPEALGRDAHKFIYLNMELIHTEETFFQRLCKEVGVEYCRGYDLIEALQEEKYIICIDEIEKMRNPEKFSGNEREELRGLADGSDMPLTLITASRSSLDELFPDDQYATSPFFNIFTQILLEGFTTEVAYHFLRKRLDGAPIQFSETQIQTLIEESSGHPGRIQQLANFLYISLLENREQ